MNIGIYQETKPATGSNVLVGAIYKKTAPTVLIASHTWTGPYTGQTQTFSFTGLLNVVYTYICWESTDGTATGTQRNNFDIQPNSNTYTTRDNLTLVADLSPFFASGGSTYGADSSLIGWNWFLERKAQGTQNPGVEYIKTKGGVNTTIDDTAADGWKLAVAGDVIGVSEQFIIHFYPQLAATSTAVLSNLISATNILSVNTTLTSSAIGQSYWLQGSGGFFTVTLPDLATVPDNEPLFFMSCGGSHVNVAINAFTGQTINFYRNSTTGASASRIILGQGERLALYRVTLGDGSKIWAILWGGEGAAQVGEIVTSYSKIGLNTLFLDGTQNLSRTTYARLWEWISGLDASCLVTATAWNAAATYDGIAYNTNHGKFNSGDGTTTFGLPKIYELGYLRALNGVVGSGTFNGFPGDFQALMMYMHKHAETVGLLPNEPNGQAAPPINPVGGAIDMGKYGNPGNLNVDLTSAPISNAAAGATASLLTQVGAENHPSSYGVYMSIRI